MTTCRAGRWTTLYDVKCQGAVSRNCASHRDNRRPTSQTARRGQRCLTMGWISAMILSCSASIAWNSASEPGENENDTNSLSPSANRSKTPTQKEMLEGNGGEREPGPIYLDASARACGQASPSRGSAWGRVPPRRLAQPRRPRREARSTSRQKPHRQNAPTRRCTSTSRPHRHEPTARIARRATAARPESAWRTARSPRCATTAGRRWAH